MESTVTQSSFGSLSQTSLSYRCSILSQKGIMRGDVPHMCVMVPGGFKPLQHVSGMTGSILCRIVLQQYHLDTIQ